MQENQSQSTANAVASSEQSKTRVITVVTTRGEKKKIEFSGSKWSDLKKQLQSSYDLNNMKCVESLNKTTLEHPEAVVPEGDFALFLMPYKSKSGAKASGLTARQQVKELFASNKEAAKAHFGNYTQKKEEELGKLLKTFKPAKAAKKTATKAEAKPAAKKATVKETKVKPAAKAKVAPVKKEVAKTKEEEVTTSNFATVLAMAKALPESERKQLLRELASENGAASVVSSVQASKAVAIPEKDLDKEMRDLARGFTDVKSF